MMRSRPVNARARRIALIAASVPELTNLTRSIDGTSDLTASPSSCSSATWRAEARALLRCRGNRLDQRARGVAVNERPPRHHVVDEAIAVDVFDDRARPTADEERRSADGLKRANRTVNAAGKDLTRSGEELLRLDGFFIDVIQCKSKCDRCWLLQFAF